MKKLIEKIIKSYEKENGVEFEDTSEIARLIRFAFEYEKNN